VMICLRMAISEYSNEPVYDIQCRLFLE
jgi:hypothetical protein